ncbi:MAG: TrkA family potassium uptake protein [Candidatus Abyssobacteria bacterium SURF_5]|uniref:Trk system potassium uptake protein TrkA n=1 Tax=Abyssobacteria bacterium (strain SURF_5) TaxID=2093360 RepID=A0A3A4PDT9_ABYX5|nr:MAG: TrkA family potassium uptake protein [Candidatus Abyssubacteria bacterium SURF_5]
MRVIIVGGEKLVYFLGRLLISGGSTVAVISKKAEECQEIVRQLESLVICGDGSDPRRLEEAEAGRADAVVAVTPYDADNLVICQIASRNFGVPRTIALLNDPNNELLFKRLGVSSVFNQTKLISTLIRQRLSVEDIVNLFPIAEEKVNATEIRINDGHPCANKQLMDIPLPPGALLAVVIRGESVIIPRGDTRLLPGDSAILITTPKEQGPALRILTGEK